MKNFFIGMLIGVTASSGIWWTLQRPFSKDVPEVPFNQPGNYKIRSAKGYLVIERNTEGIHISIHRNEESARANNVSSVAISSDWIQSDDWFAYIDNASRTWLFNGKNNVIVLVERDGIIYSHHARDFAPEDELLTRLPYFIIRQTWEDQVRRRWQRLNLCEQDAS